MKHTILSLYLICGLIIITSGKLHAEKNLPIGYHEKLYKVMELPFEEYYNTSEGLHVDLGIKYTMYEFLGLPLYQKGEAIFIGYLDKDNYLLFSQDLILTIATLNNIDNINQLIKLPFWDKWGGKLIISIPLILFLFIILLYKKRT